MLRPTTSVSVAALAAVGLSLAVPVPADAQRRARDGGDWCRDWNERDRDRGWFCEVRELTLSARDLLAVDAAPNGGISIVGWDRNEILVRAKVAAQAPTDAEAREMVGQVRIDTDARTVRADGPGTARRWSWWVSYEIFAPRVTNLDLESQNGGIAIAGMRGQSAFQTVNGGITLEDMAGDVRGRTTNGGLHIDLAGQRWDGDGLDVQTTNGGIRLSIPATYHAQLETGTVNGGLEIGFPVLVQGRINRRLSVTLGEGGKLVRAVTTNGGVVVRKN